MYNGKIKAIGTRYCPSIEDKVERFSDKISHQIYLEPEGAFTEEYYINGISTSLPVHIQNLFVKSINGLENSVISRYAYAVEYDAIDSYQISPNLSLKKYPNLFTAGQINGTSGYEEAGGQGLLAGINAFLFAKNQSEFILGRDKAYMAVMVDDLVNKEITEPYRLFTSRAEHRLLLRQDNADFRLSKIAYDLGVLPYEKYKVFIAKEKIFTTEKTFLNRTKGERGKTLWEHLKTKSYKELIKESKLDKEMIHLLETEAKYENYIKRENSNIEKIKYLDKWEIPKTFSYKNITGLKNETQYKLEKFRPQNLSQASRIDGVTPTEITLLQINIKKFSYDG